MTIERKYCIDCEECHNIYNLAEHELNFIKDIIIETTIKTLELQQ